LQPTVDQLAVGILHLGYDDDITCPLAEIQPEVWVELLSRGHINLTPDGDPKLTAKGQKTFTAIVSGEDLPEFDYGDEGE
jgi:hypothetical protein